MIKEHIRNYIDNNEEAKLRITICESCDEYHKDNVTCKICGCYMYAKVIFSPFKCPVGKW